MKPLQINSNEVGISITIPYQDNANYSRHFPTVDGNFARDVIGAWSKHLQTAIKTQMQKMEASLGKNLTSMLYVSKNLLVGGDGSKFPIGVYGSLAHAYKALEDGSFKSFLCCHSQQAIHALLFYRDNPAEQNKFTFEQLVEVLTSADHDCIEW